MRLRSAAPALVALLLLAGHAAAAGDVRPIEAVGVVPLDAEAPPKSPPRDAALRVALSDAVRRVALEHLPDMGSADSDALLEEALGDEPLDYVSRFRILEDRGERPALFVEDPEVETEYVVVVEVHVDADRVRERLAGAGLLVAPSGEGGRVRLRIVIEDLESYAAYAALRRALLENLRVRAALPLLMERRRAVLAVEADRGGERLLDDLLRSAPEPLRITPLRADRETLVLRVRLAPQAAGAGRGKAAAARAIDTPGRNRY
jgi:hypothetical protein